MNGAEDRGDLGTPEGDAGRTQARQVVLEEKRPLSESLLWRLQRAYFERRGIDAWRQGEVPHYISSNPYLARACARVVLGFLRDWQAASHAGSGALDTSQPLYIVELGSGSGRFAFHFLKKFSPLHQRSTLHDVPVKLVMTDFASAIVEYWRTHPSLQPMAADGLLDFAYFDAERPEALTLLHSGESLAHGLVKNPIILLGNYFFDSIPQDCFTVRDGELYENLVTLLGPGDLGPGDDPRALEHIEIQYLSRRMGPERYDDPHLNEVLRAYQERVPSATFLLPAAGLRCLRFFEEMSAGRLMLLTADKAYHREEELAGRGPPVLDLHGSFSVMVNYHAMAEYVRSRGGQARFKKHKASILNVAAFLFGAPGSGYTETMLAFTEAIEESDPADFFALKRGIEPHYADLTLDQILALLRLSGWDSNILLGCYPVLLDRVQSASEAGCRALREAIDATWETYLPIGEEHDVASCAGTLLASMRRYREAIAYFERSVQMYGPKAETVFNMGMCYYELRQLPAALEHVKWALALDPHYEGAEALRSRLLGELARH